MSKEFNESLIATIISGLGFIFVLVSPGRDVIANWTLLLGLAGNLIMHGINSILLWIRSLRDFQAYFFMIKIINFAFIVLAIIGMLLGKYLAIWSPFWFFPFGYYVFIAFAIIYTLYFDLGQLYTIYLLIRIDAARKSRCLNCQFVLNPKWSYCPICGTVKKNKS